MRFRMANSDDLPMIKEMYGKIIEEMYKNDIKIWNEYYPCECFLEDIELNRLFVLENDVEVVAACTLCNSNSGEDVIKWNEETKDVWYIDRLGVNVNYLRQGIGQALISNVKNYAKENGKKYLRLFVVDVNIPAIKLYEKAGFDILEGVYNEEVYEGHFLTEYAFELKV